MLFHCHRIIYVLSVVACALSVPTGYPMDTTIIAQYVKANLSYMKRLLTFQISTNTT